MLKSQHVIYDKLEAFIKKYYTNELIKGSLFFIGLGLIYFLVTLFIEYLLWLKPSYRTFLFVLFIIVEAFLFFRFILIPVFKLFKLKSGIDYKEASAIIGTHFSEVQDKLINFLQLSQDQSSVSSELVLASIEQKSNTLSPIPFGNAINFKANSKYYPLALAPLVFVFLIYFTGNSAVISQSLNRVVNFSSPFQPPAPFKFIILNKNLQVEQGSDFTLRMKTVGKVVPENIVVFLNDETYFMEQDAQGEFSFKITKPIQSLLFHVEANGVLSPDYELNVIEVPSIADFEMYLQFPSYLNKKSEIIKGTGNAMVPEGTLVTWKLNTSKTQSVSFFENNQKSFFVKSNNTFQLSKRISRNLDYQITISNTAVTNFEKLNYEINTIADQFPSIMVSKAPDSLNVSKNFVIGQVSDDYGLSKLQIVYYDRKNPSQIKRGTIAIKKASFDQFVFAFPSNLPVSEGVDYEYYFEVFDTDALHNFKSTKSSIFSNRVVTEEEKVAEALESQSRNVSGLSKSLKQQDKQFSSLDKFQQLGKEKDILDFKDQQKLDDFMQRQMKQDAVMKEFTRKMNENLSQFKTEKKDAFKEELQKRLEKAEKDLDKNDKLLDELKSLTEKIQNDQLFSKLEKFKQNSKNQVKSLEQLVELTKKYYVEKKAEQLQEQLSKLANKQENLSNDDKLNKTDNQKEINEEFNSLKKELDALSKENKELKAPLSFPNSDSKKKDVDEELNKAISELSKNNKEKAKSNQKNASKKMKQMAQEMAQEMESAEQEQMEEDVAMLRQILDNLLSFSLTQEDLMYQFKKFKPGSPAFNKNIKIQQDLKQQFKHADDSLFAMSLRNPKFTDDITKEIGNVSYNLDKSLSTFTDAQIAKGLSHQQYTVSSANKLADFLSSILSSMQSQMSGMGQGKPKPGSNDGMQLPDIIKKMDGLADKMKEGQKSGKTPKPGSSGKPSQSGSKGESGEGEAQDIMDIYKEQRQLRESLQNELNNKGIGAKGQNALEQMKALEKQLLNKGFNNENMQRILNIKQELLKLKSAIQEQGEDTKRQSETNQKEFNGSSNRIPAALLDYLNSKEILNRQSLPLRSNFNTKVQVYFNNK
ncbi:hypothetical protein FVB9288_03212 [Flavobacterium sp. CECT 9288]|uniref:DUF4175 family protein n=1 Tax=Flavobacterium sp. CECT 9288 TaxID=2845819 RepID=UPI001E3467DB|nr:DUF4175 family protein [Flavobacterium sp. CECT 9288]CAH0337451.1 hypothetical protein FVB9288_03212 [Flavobacterium sp. CECT 9288]